MAFDAIELLNAFDIIKNETLYSKRLQALADAQAHLNESKFIVETIEIAQARLDEANRLLEQAQTRRDKFDVELEQERIARLKDVSQLEEKLDKRTKELDALASKLNVQRQEVAYDEGKLEKGQKALQHSIEDYDQRRLEVNAREEKFMAKLEQLRKIIES